MYWQQDRDVFQPRFRKLGVNSHVPSLEGLSDDSQRLPRQRFDHLTHDPTLLPCLNSSNLMLAEDAPCQLAGSSAFQIRCSRSSLHNSIDSSRMLADPYLSSVQCSRLNVRPKHSLCRMSVKFFVCPSIFPCCCSAIFTLFSQTFPMRVRCPSHGSRSMLKRRSLWKKTRDRVSEKYVLIMEERWQKLPTICTGYECSRDQVKENCSRKTSFPEPLRSTAWFSSSCNRHEGTYIVPQMFSSREALPMYKTSRAKWHVSAVLHSSSSWRHRCILGLLP